MTATAVCLAGYNVFIAKYKPFINNQIRMHAGTAWAENERLDGDMTRVN